MTDYRFILEKYQSRKNRYTCPMCEKPHSFARYIDRQTNEYLSPMVGRCDRSDKCGYHYKPKDFFSQNPSYTLPAPTKTFAAPLPPITSYIPLETLKETRTAYEKNNLISYLLELFEPEIVHELIKKYHLGTSKKWPGASILWQLDKNGKVRTGKVMLFDPKTGKRVKKPFNHFTWAHYELKLKDFNLKQCLFGEHLLKLHPYKKVAIVESERAAIVASVYFPEFLWMACGGKDQMLNKVKSALKGRTVKLFPDASVNGIAYNKWKAESEKLKDICTITVSDFLEKHATHQEKEDGVDIEDYLVNFSYKDFVSGNESNEGNTGNERNHATEETSIYLETGNEKLISEKEDIDRELKELEYFFNSINPPERTYMLNEFTSVSCFRTFMRSHVAYVSNVSPVSERSLKTYIPYLERLRKLKELLLLEMEESAMSANPCYS